MARKQPIPIDLRQQNPCGRVDVLAAGLIDELTQRVPELRPIVDERREAIQDRLTKLCGPSVFDFGEVVQAAQPYMPLINAIANKVWTDYQEKQKREQAPVKSTEGNTA